jgi:hypothetical protein
MLSSISSSEFIGMVIIATCVYYGVVLIKYYRKELRNLLPGRHKYQNEARRGSLK